MPHEVIMPALGMAQDTGLIVAWRKAEGEKVATGDVLFEVETDKATMEVEAQAAGYLTGVSAAAGQDVPVGTVIALIADSADAPSTSATAAPAASEAPAAEARGKAIIMPALGMAQDTGLLVSWHKAPGDAVAADDILFEVETDKSTVEVPAGVDGYLAALHANPGDEVPVGETIAIVSAEKPANPVQTSRAAGGAAPAPAAPPAPAKPVARPAAPAPGPALPANGRILASPKARRLALEQGLDLARLAAAGHPQPFHSADLDRLRALPAPATPSGTASGPLPGLAAIPATAARRLTADLPADGFREFATWAADTAGLADSGALLAGLAAASLGRASTVAVETLGRTHLYSAPLGPLHAVAPAAADADAAPAPDLILRDLRAGSVTTVALGAEAAPVLTLTRAAAGLQITLECAADQLTAAQAVALLDGFAGRIAQPLRHLL